jgi:hypothetical protein
VLRIRLEEELPVYERLGDVRERAIVLGKIGDVLAARGERDRALTIWREALDVFERRGEPGLSATARQRIARLLGTRRLGREDGARVRSLG